MIKNGLVTIVIPCYNQSHFLGEAIKSVLGQTYENYEVIVVNDGSTDETSEVAMSFNNVKVIEQNNMGLSASRNVGLSKSNGEFIVFLDSDDKLLPQALEIGVKSLEDRPECAFVSGFCDRISFDGSYLPTYQPIIDESDYYMSLLRSNYIWAPSNVMYRREVFEKTPGFNTEVSPAADYEIYLRIARLFPVYHHGHIVTEYRQHKTSMSKDYGLMLKNVLTVLQAQWEFVKKNKRHKAALEYGIPSYKQYYLEGVCVQAISSLKDYKLRQVMQYGLVLMSYPTTLPGLFNKLIRGKMEKIFIT